MKPGDFVRIRGSAPHLYARVEEIRGDRLYCRNVDGWTGYWSVGEVVIADLSEVWWAIEVEQSRIHHRIADLNKTRALAFERALKAGR